MNGPFEQLPQSPQLAGGPEQLEASASFDADVMAYIRRATQCGIYDIRGMGAKRRLPTFDDLVFLTASASRYPLEGYREQCTSRTVLGGRFASKPIELEIPVTIAGMSFGSLSASTKDALGRAASEMGTSTTTGDGGMTPEERESSKTLVYQCLPSRYGFNPDDLRQADAIEIVIGQGAKPGGGGMLLGQKVSPRVAGMRTLPEGIDQRSACRHPDWTGPDDLKIKIEELREITDWEIPVYVKLGATRVVDDVKLAVKAGADVVVIAPASADFLARLRNGFADELASALCLATGAPVLAALSEDHKPSLPAERARIEAAGGTMASDRVDGRLATSRAFGDFEFLSVYGYLRHRGILRCAGSPARKVAGRSRSEGDRRMKWHNRISKLRPPHSRRKKGAPGC